jgi:undecaprenyl-diphosphatase
MDITLLLKAIVMGIVEGLTEFLPVSSTGHLIIVGSLLHFPADIAPTFEIFIQFGAILAVVVFFARDLSVLVGDVLKGNVNSRRILIGVLIAVLPAGIVGVIFNRWIKANLFNPVVVAVMLLLGGIVMLLVEWKPRSPSVTQLSDVTLRHALQIGLAQVVSLIPGTSRSMATIVGGLLSGLDRTTAVRFSFYLSIPTMIAASLYDFTRSSMAGEVRAESLPVFVVGLVVSFAVALVVVRLFLGYISQHTLKPFALYRIGVEVVLALLAAAGLLAYAGR